MSENSKKIIIHIDEVDEEKLIGIELKNITNEEAISVLNRCQNKLIKNSEYSVEVLSKKTQN